MKGGDRLRVPPLPDPPRIVLVEPEIPQNTGNIARIAAALQCPLHLVGRLGFSLDERRVRRAGLDYWPLVRIEQHLDLAHFRHAYPGSALRLFSAVGKKSYLAARYQPGDALVFGRESVGLPDELLAEHDSEAYSIPTVGEVRSLNLANAAAIVVYEAFRQLGAFSAA
jgi:tRNA (cytidine/uridine-2'-O-)-methyltransferase